MDLCFYLIHELAQILQYLYLFLWIPTVGVSEAQTGILDDEMGSTLDTNYAYDIWHKTMFNEWCELNSSVMGVAIYSYL